MTLKAIENNLEETLLVGTASSGLKYLLNPKPGFSKTMGVLGVRFGSTDNTYTLDGKILEVPGGTAHFLEHKLFEDKEGDVSDRFISNGASCNAGTGFTTTSYLFSCTARVNENLKLLLDFVQSPYFTPELIAKEQGIIEQEIKMYNDDPDWIVFFNLMKSLYRQHPVRENIAGSVESIARIDTGVLEECYRGFYRPGNMVLVLAGNLDPDEASRIILEDAKNRVKDSAGLNHRMLEEADAERARETVSSKMVVARSKILIGFKDREISADGRALQAKEIITQMVLDILFGKSSQNFDELYSEGTVDDSFSAYYSGYHDFGFTSIGGDTDDPARFHDRVLAVLETESKKGIDAESFRRQKNKYLGKFIRTFNSVESTAYSLLGFYFKGLYPHQVLEIIEGITLEDLNGRLATHFKAEHSARSVIEPDTSVLQSKDI
jgi:predicted Zn-dependent peptidase